MNKKVVVTGGAGFIGSNLVDGLIAAGYDVHVIDNLIAGKKEQVNPKATLHIKDICSVSDIEPILKNTDVVFHLAALPRVQDSIDNPAQVHEVNVTGTLNMLVASSKAKVRRFIFTSSAAVYGDQQDLPLKESHIPTPKSPYGLHKQIGEQYARLWNELYGLETVSLRYFNVYGPRQSAQGSYPLVIAKFIDLKKQNKPLTITGSGEQTRDFVHVSDIVAANIAAAENKSIGKGEVINIGSGVETSVKTVASTVGGQIEYIAARVEPSRSVADVSLAAKLLQWKSKVDFKKGIADLLI